MTQSEVLEEDWRRPVHERTSKPFAATNDIDEATLVQRLQHAADRDATNLLDLGATDRLAIRDDGERLQRGRGQALRASGQLRTFDRFGVFGTRQDLPATGDLLQLDTVSLDVVVLAQFIDGGGERRRRLVRRQRREFFGGDGARAREQRGLKQLR